MEELKETLKKQIIEALSLEDMRPEDIDDAAPLFGDGLGLDSIDALELIVLMEKQYGIRLNNPAEGKEILASVNTMVEYRHKYARCGACFVGRHQRHCTCSLSGNPASADARGRSKAL